MSESDKAALRRIPLEALNQGRLEVIDEVVADDYRDHSPGITGAARGPEVVKSIVRSLRTAFPDIHFAMIHEVSEGNMVVQHVHASGTMLGELQGMKPTGKCAEWDEVHVVRMRDGKAVEHWPAVDQLGILTQIGVIREPAARAA